MACRQSLATQTLRRKPLSVRLQPAQLPVYADVQLATLRLGYPRQAIHALRRGSYQADHRLGLLVRRCTGRSNATPRTKEHRKGYLGAVYR